MELFENEEILKPKKKKEIKVSTILIIAIILLTILCIVAIVAIVYIKGTILTISLDGKNAKELEQVFIIEENQKVYMPIKRMAEYLGYNAYTGDYGTRSEDDTTKCYIESNQEVVSFNLDSNIITKVIENQTQQIKIAEPIKEINGEMCITAEGAQDAFNFKFYYQENKITIQTLSYLYSWYSQYAVNKGYQPIETETFRNKTAILDNMLIVKSQNNNYGVISTVNENEMILETKYESIQYIREAAEFMVKSNGKNGIIARDKTTKLELVYDSIERITNKNDIYYVVSENGLYGLLDESGSIIIHPEYDKIGVDVSSYKENGITNGYILFNEIVPIKRNEKWAIFNIKEGKRITDFKYDSFGCPHPTSDTPMTYGVIGILDYSLLVVCQGEKYNLITIEGKDIFANYIIDNAYIKVSEGQQTYYIKHGTQTTELISFLESNEGKLGIHKVEQ